MNTPAARRAVPACLWALSRHNRVTDQHVLDKFGIYTLFTDVEDQRGDDDPALAPVGHPDRPAKQALGLIPKHPLLDHRNVARRRWWRRKRSRRQRRRDELGARRGTVDEIHI